MTLYKGLIVKAIDPCEMSDGRGSVLTIDNQYTVLRIGNTFGVINDEYDYHEFGDSNAWEKFFTTEGVTQDFRNYKRTGTASARPVSTTDIRHDRLGTLIDSSISISKADIENGSPRVGDMIARNPKDFDDKWLIAAQYFNDNFALAE